MVGFAAGDGWSVAQNLAHLAIYEERLGAPLLEDLACGGDGTGIGLSTPREDQFLAEWESLAQKPIETILARLHAARARHVAALMSFTEARFNAPVTTFFPPAYGRERYPAGWVAAKTVQHTWEHGNTVLRVALFAPRTSAAE